MMDKALGIIAHDRLIGRAINADLAIQIYGWRMLNGFAYHVSILAAYKV